jgi:hypothetical protein
VPRDFMEPQCHAERPVISIRGAPRREAWSLQCAVFAKAELISPVWKHWGDMAAFNRQTDQEAFLNPG